jgi:hypothetical protein
MALSFAAVLLAASPVLAHHISGTVYCDQDLDGTIDAGDTPVSGIDILITSIDAQPGQMFSQTTLVPHARHPADLSRRDDQAPQEVPRCARTRSRAWA